MKIGYARISTAEQSLALQEDALKEAGCVEIYTDVASGARAQRPGLERVLEYIREGDTLVVWKLDRLGRSISHLIETIKSLEERNIGFKCLQESIDTSTSTGKLIFYIFSALAEFERDLFMERSRAGMTAARARGRVGGRPPLLNAKEVKRMMELYQAKTTTVKEICQLYKITRPSFYNYLKRERQKNEN